MTGLAEVMARLVDDQSFADLIRTDPATALRGYQLDPSELARLERVLGAGWAELTLPLAPLDDEP